MHAIAIGEWTLQGVGVMGFQRTELSFPPRVGLQRQDNIRIKARDDLEERMGVPVGHQYVATENAQAVRVIPFGGIFDLLWPETGKGYDPARLIKEDNAVSTEQQPGSWFGEIK